MGKWWLFRGLKCAQGKLQPLQDPVSQSAFADTDSSQGFSFTGGIQTSTFSWHYVHPSSTAQRPHRLFSNVTLLISLSPVSTTDSFDAQNKIALFCLMQSTRSYTTWLLATSLILFPSVFLLILFVCQVHQPTPNACFTNLFPCLSFCTYSFLQNLYFGYLKAYFYFLKVSAQISLLRKVI